MSRASLGVAAFVGTFCVGAAAEAAVCRGRPTDPAGYQGHSYAGTTVQSYSTTRARVHYATSGMHAPDPATTRMDGVPDTVALAGDVAEKALTKYAEMGFKTPPSDAACASNGGDAKLDVYLVSFAGADGTTVAEACEGRACASFVLVESTFAGHGYPTAAEGFRTVIAHELFHAVQNAYDSDVDRFWAEGSAQWGMKNAFPDVADFENQLPAFFKDPARSLDTQPSGVTAGFLYGSAVWPLFLTLRHGPDTVRRIFEVQGDGATAIPATASVLESMGSSLAEEMPLFGAWNAATKTLSGSGGYPDAAKYPGVKAEALVDGAKGITSGLGYFVYRGTLDAQSRVSLETDAARNGGILVPIEGGKAVLERAAKLPTNVDAGGEVLVVVAGTTTKKTDAPFAVRIGPAEAETGEGTPGGSSGAPGTSSGGSGGDEGGCSVVSAKQASGTGTSSGSRSTWLAIVGVALAGIARATRRGRRDARDDDDRALEDRSKPADGDDRALDPRTALRGGR